MRPLANPKEAHLEAVVAQSLTLLYQLVSFTMGFSGVEQRTVPNENLFCNGSLLHVSKKLMNHGGWRSICSLYIPIQLNLSLN